MLIARGVLAQYLEPEAHDKVLDNNTDRIGIWKCWFLRRGGNRKPLITPTESRNRTQATLVGGECSHHCAIAVTANNNNNNKTRATFSISKKEVCTKAIVTYSCALFRALIYLYLLDSWYCLSLSLRLVRVITYGFSFTTLE